MSGSAIMETRVAMLEAALIALCDRPPKPPPPKPPPPKPPPPKPPPDRLDPHKRHGKDLCFTGVILAVAHNNVADFDRIADIAASLAKWVIGADGAILTKTGGGAPELAMARTAQRCEQLGIKTAIAMLHMGADFKDAKYGASTIFSMPEVDAIVSMGVPYMELTLPAVERVLGGPASLTKDPAIKGEIVQWLGSIKGSLCQLGSSNLTAVRY